jgi:hypothetical protein
MKSRDIAFLTGALICMLSEQKSRTAGYSNSPWKTASLSFKRGSINAASKCLLGRWSFFHFNHSSSLTWGRMARFRRSQGTSG